MAPAAAALPCRLSFRPFTVEAARRNTRSPRKPRSTRTLKSSPSPSSSGSSSRRGGGAATTFTRLPIRDSVPLDQFPTAPAQRSPKAPAFTRQMVEHPDDEEEEEEELDYGVGGTGSTASRERAEQFGSFPARRSRKGRTFVPQELDKEEEELDYGGGGSTTFARLPVRDSPTTSMERAIAQFGSFPARTSRKGRTFVPQELAEEEEEEEDDDDVVFDTDYEGGSDDDERAPKGLTFARKKVERLEEDGDGDDDEVIVFDPDGGSDEEDGEVKEKGVPAVMRCFDRARIYAKAGDGGNGVVAFRREKYVPYGGPSGGDGGRGGNVYVEVDGAMNSLLPFRKSVHFRAGRGAHGQGREQAGVKGEDVVVKVPPGTVVRVASGGAELLELMRPGQRAMILPGGRGGRGNAAFKSGNNKVPRIAEKGEQGAEV